MCFSGKCPYERQDGSCKISTNKPYPKDSWCSPYEEIDGNLYNEEDRDDRGDWEYHQKQDRELEENNEKGN